ncbi:MAG: NADH-quinone oxidoreductase subunit N [Chitinophagaceae bacterium]|nr:NADH-quinone oxidoreductase subunit N [Chitinophagaceae bacterium]
MISLAEFKTILPEVILSAGAVLVLIGIAVKRNFKFSYLLTLLTLLASLYFLTGLEGKGEIVSNLFVMDGQGKFVSGLIICSSLVISFFTYYYFKGVREETREEYFVLLLLATLGAAFMTISSHFISFVISLEVLSVSLFALIGYMRHKKVSIEAGIKYLILAAAATSFILFGFALIYTSTGKMNLHDLSGIVSKEGFADILSVAGLGMVIVGFGFKMALVPFHFWTPDIYAAAPTPGATFVATVSKGAAFVFLLRFFYSIGGLNHEGVWVAFAVIATASMFIGNWLGLRQQNLKRLFAYSSISHLGYLMVAFLAFSNRGIDASSFYLLIYFISMLAAFGMIIYLSGKGNELEMVDDYRGLFWRRPVAAAVFTVVMLSLAGVPLTAGFMGKFLVLSAGMGGKGLFLLFVLVISSTIGLFYYLRVIAAMLSRSDVPAVSQAEARPSVVLTAVMAALFILLLWAGIYPKVFIGMLS